MRETLFYLFAGLTVISAMLVPLSRNPVHGAMCMILSFVGTAALFALLHSFFLAVLQVLVYAGAVMVLFLFIIMLLNVGRAQALRPSRLALGAGTVMLGVLVMSVIRFVTHPSTGPWAEAGSATPGAVASHLGRELFTKHLLPLEMIGLLLLAAMVGVIFISKRTADHQPPAP